MDSEYLLEVRRNLGKEETSLYSIIGVQCKILCFWYVMFFILFFIIFIDILL